MYNKVAVSSTLKKHDFHCVTATQKCLVYMSFIIRDFFLTSFSYGQPHTCLGLYQYTIYQYTIYNIPIYKSVYYFLYIRSPLFSATPHQQQYPWGFSALRCTSSVRDASVQMQVVHFLLMACTLQLRNPESQK